MNGSADIMVSRYVAPFDIIVGGISCCSTLRERCAETTMDVVWIRWLVAIPVQYSDLSIANSCLHTRSRASIFDVGRMSI